jgi:hypothetical protein
MAENLPVRREQRQISQFEAHPTPGEIVPATRAPSPPAPRPDRRPDGVARVWAPVPATTGSSDPGRDLKPVIGQITATNVTVHIHGTTIQQHQEVVYGDRHSAVAVSQPPQAPDGPALREPLGGLAFIGVVVLAIAGVAFLAGCAWHAITSRTPSVVIEQTRTPRSFVEELRSLHRE